MDKGVILNCFLWICPVFASNVDILVPDSLAYGKTCECGRDLTLSCKFKNKTFAIAWMNPNDISPIAQCVRNRCDINPKYIDQYKISYDEKNHIFNLTIIKLTKKDNGRKLVCSDGTNIDSMIIRVRDYEPLLFENTTTGTIQAISGCISNVTKVSFKWIKIDGRSKREKEMTPKIHNTTTTSCSNNSDCGNDQQMQYSEVITAKASDNGNCYLKIVADYGNEHKESYHTVERYMIEDQDEEIEERSNILIVIAVVLFDFALVLTAAVYLIYLHHKVKKDGPVLQKHNEEEEVISSAERLLSNCHCSVQGMSNKEDVAARMHTSFDNTPVNAIPEIDYVNVKHLELTGNENSLNVNEDKLEKGTLIERNEEDNMLANNEANYMSVNEPTVSHHSFGQALPENEEGKNLSSKEKCIIDTNRDQLGNGEKQTDLHIQQNDLNGEIHINVEENDLSVIKSIVNTHCIDQAVPEIEEEKDPSSKDHIIIDLHPNRDETENDETQKDPLVQQNDLDDEILKNDKENDICGNESVVNANCLGQAVHEFEEKDLSSKDHIIIELHPNRDEIENDEKQKYPLVQQNDLDDEIHTNNEENDFSDYNSTVNAYCLVQTVSKIEVEKDLSSKEPTKDDLNTDRDEFENDEKQTYLLAKQSYLDDDMLEYEEYHSAEEYDSIDLVDPT